jgi:Lar family restriction alleviation protein
MATVIDYQRPQKTTHFHGLYLIECPFCGSAPVVRNSESMIVIECKSTDCKAQPSVAETSEREAVSLWNHRR